MDFIRDVKPLFENKCLECHNPNKIKGKLQEKVKQFAEQALLSKKLART